MKMQKKQEVDLHKSVGFFDVLFSDSNVILQYDDFYLVDNFTELKKFVSLHRNWNQESKKGD